MTHIEKAADDIIRTLAGRDQLCLRVVASKQCLEPLREALRTRVEDRPEGWDRWDPSRFVHTGSASALCGVDLDLFWIVTTLEEFGDNFSQDILDTWLACNYSDSSLGNMNIIVLPYVS